MCFPVQTMKMFSASHCISSTNLSICCCSSSSVSILTSIHKRRSRSSLRQHQREHEHGWVWPRKLITLRISSPQLLEPLLPPAAANLNSEPAPEKVGNGGTGSMLVSEFQPVPDLDYLQELLAIQQGGPRTIGFFGTRNMGFMHQQLIEILSYAMIITKNHIFTSGASGTNAAVIRGALRAEKPDLLTVILPQSLKKQPLESQELLSKVRNVIEKPENDDLPLIEASRLCNMDIISNVLQVICFAFHDSRLLLETCEEAKNLRKIVTLFYLD